MQRRCRWPPERLVPGADRRSFTLPTTGKGQAFDNGVEVFSRPGVDAAVSDVVIDRFRERPGSGTPCRRASSSTAHIRIVDVFAVHQDLPPTRQFSIVSFIRLRQRRKVDLPQPEGPISAVIARSGYHRIVDGLRLAVESLMLRQSMRAASGWRGTVAVVAITGVPGSYPSPSPFVGAAGHTSPSSAKKASRICIAEASAPGPFSIRQLKISTA